MERRSTLRASSEPWSCCVCTGLALNHLLPEIFPLCWRGVSPKKLLYGVFEHVVHPERLGVAYADSLITAFDHGETLYRV